MSKGKREHKRMVTHGLPFAFHVFPFPSWVRDPRPTTTQHRRHGTGARRAAAPPALRGAGPFRMGREPGARVERTAESGPDAGRARRSDRSPARGGLRIQTTEARQRRWSAIGAALGYSSVRPSRMAYLVSSATLCRSSFSMICCRYVSTVFTLTASRPAMALVESEMASASRLDAR